MNLELRSNDSLDRQVSAYISEGRFHVALLSLIILVVWVIYVFFYNARLFGILSSLVLRKFVKNGFIKIGSLSISPVCGKIMIRDLVYLTEDFSVRCCYVVLVFNYWKPFQPQAKHLSNRRLYIYLYGLDAHIFNRTSVYDNLRKLFELNPQTDNSHNPEDGHRRHPSLVIIHPDASYPTSTDHDPIHPETEPAAESSMGWIWTRCELLFPVVKFNLEMSKVTFGNHLMPRTLVITCHKANGVYSTEPTSYAFGKYLHVMKLDFSNFMGSLAAVSKYSGHYATEDPPKGAEIYVFNFGKGKITYEQDEPDWGLIRNSGNLSFDEGGQNSRDVPKWDMSVNVSKDFLLAYGPWADRQREIIWKFFFPASYRPVEVPRADELNPHRANERFLLKVISQTDVRLDLWFLADRVAKSFSVFGKSNSVFELNLPWTSGPNGFTSSMHLCLSHGRLITDCLWPEVLLTSEFKMDLRIHYPLEWNALQTWDFDIDGKEAKFCFLYNQKNYFKEFFEDWSSGSRPDILSFVPYIYTFRINARPLELRLLANDFNWVTPTPENAFIAFCLKKFALTFTLPFSEFLPTTVPVEFSIKAATASCCLSLPETSTMLYVIKELHNNLKLVDCKCRPQQQNPFKIIEEVLEPGKDGQPGHKRYWIECWRAPLATVRIVYTYHPIPWVPNFWRFLPEDWDLRDAGGPDSHPSSSSPSSTLGRVRVDSDLTRHTRTPSLPRTVHDPVEVALGGLRPEGSRAHGPTESALILADFNPGYLSPDIVDVHLSVPSSQLVFYGALLRQFIHVKEVYFGCYQTPATSADLTGAGVPAKGDAGDATNASPSTRRRCSSETVVDPRECRPFSVRVTLAIHNLQAHLPMHSNPGGPPCPTAFIDCIGFELDKNFFETKLQLLFSPILLCVFDRCKPFRPSGSGLLNSGRLQLTGFELRGHAMFSNRGLPLKADTAEYAWLLEVTCGTISGQITTPQVSSLVHCVSNFVFSALDPENAILPRNSGELCQHAYQPEECPVWIAKPPGAETCPTELVLKYRMLRFNLDGVELAVLEAGTCLVIMLDAVRVARCNLHDVHSRDAISVFLPRVQFLQLVRPVDQSESNHTSPFRASQQKNFPLGCPRTKLPWLEAGSLGFGPVHLHSGIAGLDPAYRDSQLYFLRRHDELTHRLWFLWCEHHQHGSKPSTSDPYSPQSNPIRCGCYGNCAFFGPNISGRKLLDEVMTGTFSRRAVFVPPAAEPIPLVPTSFRCGSTSSIGDPAMHTSRSLGVRFGESLLFPDRLLFQLHDQLICTEYSNGYALMRTEVVRADEAAKFELVPEATDPTLVCTCYHSDEDSDSECSSPEERAFEGSNRSSVLEQVHSTTNTSGGEEEEEAAASKPSSRSGDQEFSTDPFSNDPLVLQLANDADSLHSGKPSRSHRRRHKPTGLLDTLSLTSLISSVVRPTSSSASASEEADNSDSDSSSTCQPPLSSPQQQQQQPPLSSARLPAATTSPGDTTRLPPTPPPRQHGGVASSGPPPVEPASTHLPGGRREFDRTPTAPKQLSEESTFSDDESNTNIMDLQSQLNRPITESTLLRTAYSRHLNCYITPEGSICPELRLRRRWRLCPRLLHGSSGNDDDGDLNSLVGAGPSSATSTGAGAGGEGEGEKKRVRGRCRCRIGIARAPEFFCSAAGFSFRSMVDKKARPTSKTQSQTLSASFCIADLRPLLHPYMLSGTSSSVLVSRSSTTVSVLGPVDIFLTPLFIECVDRYISVMVPTMANLPPATIIDELHFRCVRSASQRGKVLYGEGEQTRLSTAPTAAVQPATSHPSFALPALLEARQQQQPTRRGLLGKHFSTGVEPEVTFRPAAAARIDPTLSGASRKDESTNTAPLASGSKQRSARAMSVPIDVMDEQDTAAAAATAAKPATRTNQFLPRSASRSRGQLVEENNLVGLLSLGRINVGFMQIYAIEDLVTVDSMTTGLHDLTCVSLLTLAVDSVKVDILHNERTTHYGTLVDTTFSDPASLIALPEPRGEEPIDETTQTKDAEVGSPPTIISDDATSEFTAASPLLSHEQPTTTPGTPHVVAFQERTSIPSATLAEVPTTDLHVEDPLLRRLPVVREVRQTARLVCNFSISRIHSQLRRLTRDSNFNPDVLLTAIPFQSSRVFFAFDSDAVATAAAGAPSSSSPLRRADLPSPLGPPKPLPPPRPAPAAAPPQSAQSFLHGHSAGWIMVECGMEQLTLLFVQRKGFGDSVQEYQPGGGKDGRKMAATVNPTDANSNPAGQQDTEGGAANRKSATVRPPQVDEFARMEEGLSAENQVSQNSRSARVKPFGGGACEEESRMKNALLMHLHVQTVWLNFPAPKHLPNKRRVEIVRSDWNFLSTVTPTVNAWIGPFNRLVATSKHLYAVSERRHLSVLACLMMESVSGDYGGDLLAAASDNLPPSPHPHGRLRFSLLEDAEFSAYATWRTSESQLLRYDPSCQIFTVLRRYLQCLRAQHGAQFTDSALAEWLRESAVPENILLFRGLLLMLRQCSYCVDIFQPVRLPVTKKGFLNARRSIFRHLRDGGGKTAEDDATGAAAGATPSGAGVAATAAAAASAAEKPTTTSRGGRGGGPRERWWGQESARHLRPSLVKSLAATALAPPPLSQSFAASSNTSGRAGGILPRRPSATVLTMFDLMTSESGQGEHQRIGAAAPAASEQQQTAGGDSSSMAGGTYAASDLDETIDDGTVSETKDRCENSILSRFLQDTQAGLAEPEREARSNTASDGLHPGVWADPAHASLTGQTHLSGAGATTFADKGAEQATAAAAAELLRPSTANDPELTAEDFNRVNHLDGQFRFVDDAQRLFRPLLEAIGVNVKGVRRSTLMKKFGGLFAAEGMLETFQIEICDSLDNPLPHVSSVEGTSSLPRSARTEGGPPEPARTWSPFTGSNYRPSGRLADPRQTPPQALLCHRFSTQLTFRDTVGFSHEDGKASLPKPGDAELRSTTTQITAILRFDGIRQHSNLPLLRLLHQFVIMVYCAKDAQESVKRQQPIVVYRQGHRYRAAAAAVSKESSEDTLTTTGSTIKSHCPAYVRLSGESQRSTPDSTGFQTSSGTGDLAQPMTRTSSSSIPLPMTATAAIESRLSYSESPFAGDMAEQLVATAPDESMDNTSSSPRDADGKPQKYPGTSASLGSLPSCWRKMLANIDIFSTIPEPKNISKKPSSNMPTITEENALLGSQKTPAPSASWLPFAHFKQPPDDGGAGDLDWMSCIPQGYPADAAAVEARTTSVTSREDGRGVGTSANSLSSGVGGVGATGHGQTTDGVAPTSRATAATANVSSSAATTKPPHRFMVPWLRGERIPMVVFVTLNVRQMIVSAVLSELNLTATVRNIHGSFTQTKKIRGRSRFKEISSTYSLSGHCGDADIGLTEGSGIHILEVACIQMAPSHIFLSCSRSRRLERNACVICVGRVNVTLPHHPVRLHDMVQRQARHLSSTVSEFLQLPTSPAPSSRHPSQKIRSNANRNASVPRVSNTVTVDGHASATVTAGYQRHPLVINVSAVTKGLTVSVSLHPSLNAVYEVEPVYFLGQIGPTGFVDITLTKHALSFKSVKLPVSFPRTVSIRLPKVLTSIARCQSSGGNYALGPGGERIISQGLTTKEGSYVDIQSTIGTFDQALPSDTLNYIVVVVKLFMKEINEVIRKMAGEQQTWPSVPLSPSAGADLYKNASTSKFAVATRFTFRLKLQGIRLQATTQSGAVKLETTEIQVELSNRIERTHASWYAESSSSSLARPHRLPDSRSRKLVDGGKNKPTIKTVHPHHEPGTSSTAAATDAISCTGCESIVLFARLQHLCVELGCLDQDKLYNERAPEFRTLAFFKTSIALRSLLAEEVSAPQRHKVSTTSAKRTNEGPATTTGAPRPTSVTGAAAGPASSHLHSAAPPAKPSPFFVSGASTSDSQRSAAGSVPFVDGSTPTGSSVSGTSVSGEQEAFLVSLRRPIIWIKPSAFDRGILIWMVYTREFAKWNEQMRKLNTMSDALSTPASPPPLFRNQSVVYRSRHPNMPLLGSVSPQPTLRSVTSASTASIDNASGSAGSLLKRLPSIASSALSSRESGAFLPTPPPPPPPVRPPVTGPTLFFQLNVEDLGICLPTNILQTSPTSVEVDSRTSLVLTLSRSSLSACLHGSLVSEGEFTDFCLRFDDDFNVGSDDWKPDREKSTIRVRNEEHMIVMNGCVVPSGTSRLCWKALQKLRPDEKARWLVNVQWNMRGLDVHMDHNIGRRLKSLFVTLTSMAGYDGRAPYAQTSTEEETTMVAPTAAEAATTAGETSSDAHCRHSSASQSAMHSRRSSAFGAVSMDRLYLDEQHSGDLQTAEAQRHKLEAQYCSSYKRMKWDNLRKRTSVLGMPSGRLRRSGSLIASSKEHSKRSHSSQMGSSVRAPASISQLPGPSFPASLHSAADTSGSPTLFDPIDETNVHATASNTGSVYCDAVEMTQGSTWGPEFGATTPAMTTAPGSSRATLSFSEDGEGNSAARYSEISDQFEEAQSVFRMSSDLDMTTTAVAEGDVTPADSVFAHPAAAPPPPPPRRRPQFLEAITSVTADSPEAANTPAGGSREENESSLLFELDVHLHVDSGRCVLHPRLGGTPRRSHTKASSVSTGFAHAGGEGGMYGEENAKGFQPSPSTSIGLSQEEQMTAYLARYRRQLVQDPLQKPTDVSVFYIPAVDVGLHYTSHTKYGLVKDLHQSATAAQQHFAAAEPNPVFDETPQKSEATETVSTPVATTLKSPLSPVSSFSSQHGAMPVRPSNVGKSADLYATCVLQKLPKGLIVHPGLLDFLEQALENLPLAPEPEDDFDSEDSESTQRKSSSVPLNDLLLTNPKSFLVDVVVHVHVQSSTIRFLCLPVSQIQCNITLPSLDVVFSTDRETAVGTATGKPIHPVPFRLPSDNKPGIDVPLGRPGSTGGSATFVIGDETPRGDIVSVGGLSVTAVLTEFQMVVFHPYGGDASESPLRSWLSTSSGNSLTLKVQDIRLNISRTVRTCRILSGGLSGNSGAGAAAASAADEDTNEVKAEQTAVLPSVDSAATVRALTSTLAGTSGSSGESTSLHSVVRFSGVFDIGVAEFKCDTRRTTEILDIPHAWYRSSLARALFIGQTATMEGMEPGVAPAQTADEESLPSFRPEEEDEVSMVSDTSSRAERIRRPSLAAPTRPSIIASDNPLGSWLQKTSQASRRKFRRNAGTTGAQPSVVFRQSPVPSQSAAAMEEARRRSATTPHEAPPACESFPAGGVSNTTTLPPRMSSAAPSQGGSLGVVSWQALPIFYVNISQLDVEMYIGSAMGLTRLDARDLFCDGRMYQDSSKRRQGRLGAGVRSCQFISAKGVVGGEFSLLDLESRIYIKEDPRSDPQHSAELLIGGLQARLEYMNTNIVFLRLSGGETYLHDDWRLREAEQLLVSSLLIASADAGAGGSSSSQAEQTTATAAVEAASNAAAIGAPPVYVMVNGEVTWDQLQLAIARTTTVDLMRSARKVREYFQDQLREGRLSLIGGQSEYYLRPESSSAMAVDSLSLPTESGETHTFETSDNRIPSVPPELSGGNLDKLLQRHWQTPMLEALRACLHHVTGIGPHGLAMRRDILQANTPFESPYFDASSVPPVLSGSLQLSGKSLAVACFAGNFRSAPDWAVFDLQHPTICFETEAQREAQPRQHLLSKDSTVPTGGGAQTPVTTPTSTDEMGGWINIRQVLSFDLGQQPQYRPQTAYVLRVRRGREQNPVKLPITPTITEWMEFIFKAVDNTVISHVGGYSPQCLLDVVKLTDFAVNFPSHDALPRRRRSKARSRDPTTTRPAAQPTRPNYFGSESVGGASSSAVGSAEAGQQQQKPPESGESAVSAPPPAPPSRANPLKPPADAEILFVLPSISMRLTTDQRQSMARPRPEELLASEHNRDDPVGASSNNGAKKGRQMSPPPPRRPAKEEKQSHAGVAAAARATAVTTLPPLPQDQHQASGDGARDGGESANTAAAAAAAVRPFSAKVNISFQTDFHGVIQLGLIDVPWLPSLIASYISEQQHEFENMATPDTSYAVTPLTLQLAKDGRLGGVSASTSSPIVQDMRTYNVIHWSLSPECRWLLATNIAVPAFDMLLESIGFRRARTTIPKWLQRGALDHLDALVAALVRASLRLAVDDENGVGADGSSGRHGPSPLSLGRRISRVDVFPRLLPQTSRRESASVSTSTAARPSRPRNLPLASTTTTNNTAAPTDDSTRSNPPQTHSP